MRSVQKSSKRPARESKRQNALAVSYGGPVFTIGNHFLDDEMLEVETEEDIAEVGEDPRAYQTDELRRQGYGDDGLDFQYTDKDDEEEEQAA